MCAHIFLYSYNAVRKYISPPSDLEFDVNSQPPRFSEGEGWPGFKNTNEWYREYRVDHWTWPQTVDPMGMS